MKLVQTPLKIIKGLFLIYKLQIYRFSFCLGQRKIPNDFYWFSVFFGLFSVLSFEAFTSCLAICLLFSFSSRILQNSFRFWYSDFSFSHFFSIGTKIIFKFCTILWEFFLIEIIGKYIYIKHLGFSGFTKGGGGGEGWILHNV